MLMQEQEVSGADCDNQHYYRYKVVEDLYSVFVHHNIIVIHNIPLVAFYSSTSTVQWIIFRDANFSGKSEKAL